MVRDWVDDFLDLLSESYPPQNWPGVRTEEWDRFVEDWVSALDRNQVSKAEAEAARSLLAEAPPRFRAEYIPAVITAVKSLRSAQASGPNHDDRESARYLSKDCPHCCGGGLATIYNPDPIGAAEQRVPARVHAYCVCPMGQWVEKCHLKTSDTRFPHLAAIFDGRSVWLLAPPDLEADPNPAGVMGRLAAKGA